MELCHRLARYIAKINHLVIEQIYLPAQKKCRSMRVKPNPQHSVLPNRPDHQRPDDLSPKLDRWSGYKMIVQRRLPVSAAEVKDDLHASAGENGVFERHICLRSVDVVGFYIGV